jgi:sigma-B regulation protein RsbU (phosphoserine phosphatase)
MNRDMLSRRLGRNGYAVTLAADGAEAVALVESGSFDLVVLDVMMPGVDGLEALERIRRIRSAAELPIIMATARDGSEDVVQALQLGANDYVTKPLDFPVVLARVRTQVSLRRARRDLERAHARMKQELEAAARVQQALIPVTRPAVPGARFAWCYLPCDELAGDILDVFRLDDRRAGLYLLDVSGHGVPAALLSVTLSRTLSPTAEGSLLFAPNGHDKPGTLLRTPAEVAGRLNARFPMDPRTRQYFTFLYGILDLEAGRFRYASAGHPGPIRISRDGAADHHAGEGLPIGWFGDAVYEEREVPITSGDRIYLYSDGIPEAAGPDGDLFGESRLADALGAARRLPLESSVTHLLDAVRSWTGDRGPGDDVSIVALEVD